MKNRPRTIHTAYLYWIIGGCIFGWHRLYLRDPIGWFHYISTLGGFGVSAIKDLCRMSLNVAKWNKEAFPTELSWENNYLDDDDPPAVIRAAPFEVSRRPAEPVRSMLYIALKTYVTCLWYDWLLSKVVLFVTRPLMSTVFSYFLHRLLRPVVITVAISLCYRGSAVYNGPWWKLLPCICFGDYTRELVCQVLKWKLVTRSSPILPLICMASQRSTLQVWKSSRRSFPLGPRRAEFTL